MQIIQIIFQLKMSRARDSKINSHSPLKLLPDGRSLFSSKGGLCCWSGGRPTPHWRPPEGHCLLMLLPSKAAQATATTLAQLLRRLLARSQETAALLKVSSRRLIPGHILCCKITLKPPWPSARARLTRPKQEMEQ